MSTIHDRMRRVTLAYQVLKSWRKDHDMISPSKIFIELYTALDDLPSSEEVAVLIANIGQQVYELTAAIKHRIVNCCDTYEVRNFEIKSCSYCEADVALLDRLEKK